MLQLMGTQHLGPRTHRVRGLVTIGNLPSIVVIMGNSRRGHTLQHKVEVVVLTLRDPRTLNASSAISPVSLHKVLTLFLVGVAKNSLMHLILVED